MSTYMLPLSEPVPSQVYSQLSAQRACVHLFLTTRHIASTILSYSRSIHRGGVRLIRPWHHLSVVRLCHIHYNFFTLLPTKRPFLALGVNYKFSGTFCLYARTYRHKNVPPSNRKESMPQFVFSDTSHTTPSAKGLIQYRLCLMLGELLFFAHRAEKSRSASEHAYHLPRASRHSNFARCLKFNPLFHSMSRATQENPRLMSQDTFNLHTVPRLRSAIYVKAQVSLRQKR